MSDVPQATLPRIRSVVRAITPRVHDAKRVASESHTPYRHAQYALAAARALGLVTGPADQLKLTTAGRELASTPPGSADEARLLRRAIETSPVVKKLAPGLMGPTPPSANSIAARMMVEGDYSESTARQRAHMMLKWRDLLEPRQESLLPNEPTSPSAPRSVPRPSRQHAHVDKGDAQGELVEISAGRLGPIPTCKLQIRPFTVFVGPQGSGKSLLAQVLYFFRALPELIPAEVAATPRGDEKALSVEALVKRVLDGLRSPLRSFAVFGDPSATIRWTAEGSPRRTLGFGVYSLQRRIRPDQHLNQYVSDLITQYREVMSRAIFIPTERLFYSQVKSPLAPQMLSLPNTYLWFSDWMQRATDMFESWKDGAPDTPRGRWVHDRARAALRGEAYRWRDTWKWRFARGAHEAGILDLDMASSGQRATWPIVLLAETLFSMRKRGRLAEAFTLYVEEPEIHLHPEAQVAVVEILAYLVRNGFRVVVTTHSLPVLYALNNLVLASNVSGRRASDSALPPEAASLPKNQVAAYSFGEDGPKDLVDPETGFISEQELGRVAEQLNETMNQLTSRLYSGSEAAEK